MSSNLTEAIQTRTQCSKKWERPCVNSPGRKTKGTTNMQPIEKYKKGDRIFEIFQDLDPRNPLEDYLGIGTMVCARSRYILGHKQVNNLSEARSDIPAGSVVLPLYLLDHSGITMSVTPFACPWDSGCVGFIYATPETLEKEGITPEQAKTNMTGAVRGYDYYLRGEVYGFVLRKVNICEHCGHTLDEDSEDSCWGCLGYNLKDMCQAAGIEDITSWEKVD